MTKKIEFISEPAEYKEMLNRRLAYSRAYRHCVLAMTMSKQQKIS